MRFATYTADGKTFYGSVTDAGMIALSPHFPEWPTLLDVVQAGGLDALVQAAMASRSAIRIFSMRWFCPMRRASCVWV